MTDALQTILQHLKTLVGIDTQNPPRAITGDGPLSRLIRDALPGFTLSVTDLGDGSVIFDAVRGTPKTFFNVHLDTVPIADGWQSDPHTLMRGDDRAVGLGACDIKGAAAVLFALAAETDEPMRLVLTTDEEAGQSTCVRHFVAQGLDAELAVIAEPTRAKAVTSHRGIVSASARFSGRSGHASGGGQSAVHRAADWVHAVTHDPRSEDLRLNVGRIEGGVKPNMIAARCDLLYGFRPLPGMDAAEENTRLQALARDAEFTPRFTGPALPGGGDAAKKAQRQAENVAASLALPTAPMVDFWTEASLFAEAGLPSLVLGPGDIAQAHTADEWVSYESLLATMETYRRIVHDL